MLCSARLPLVLAILVLPLLATPAAAQTTELFRATAEGTYVEFGGGFFTFSLAGEGTPVGAFVGQGDYIVVGSEIRDGEGTFLTEDGEEIYFTFSARLQGGGTFFGALQFVGGTGRYENARGGTQLIGQVRADDSFSVALKGVITY